MSKLWLLAVFVLFVISSAGGVGAVGVIFLILIIGGVVFALTRVAKQQKKAAQNGAGAAGAAERPREFKPQHFDRERFAGGKKSVSKRLTEKMRDDLTRCDDDHEHVEPDFRASADEKRATQLKELMRNGLIEKDEYNILMRKFGLK